MIEDERRDMAAKTTTTGKAALKRGTRGNILEYGMQYRRIVERESKRMVERDGTPVGFVSGHVCPRGAAIHFSSHATARANSSILVSTASPY